VAGNRAPAVSNGTPAWQIALKWFPDMRGALAAWHHRGGNSARASGADGPRPDPGDDQGLRLPDYPSKIYFGLGKALALSVIRSAFFLFGRRRRDRSPR